MIQLDRETHKYSPNLPSVTQILKSVGIIDDSFYTEEGRERGKLVHLACEYYDQGDLDEESLDPQIKGYVDAYKNFRALTKWEFEWIEIPLSDKAHLYAGTPDRVLLSRPRRLVDLKSGEFQRSHPIQLAAYVAALGDPFSYSRYGLYLKNDGNFSIREFPKAEFMADLSIFNSALNLYYWKEKR
jgi:hypothetical protein